VVASGSDSGPFRYPLESLLEAAGLPNGSLDVSRDPTVDNTTYRSAGMILNVRITYSGSVTTRQVRLVCMAWLTSELSMEERAQVLVCRALVDATCPHSHRTAPTPPAATLYQACRTA
jgi:hypothetical protein